MLTFLFWNVNNRLLEERIARLVRLHEVDVLMLAECGMSVESVLSALNGDFCSAPGTCNAISVYTRFDPTFQSPINEGNRHTIRRLSLPGRPELLLAVVHFPK